MNDLLPLSKSFLDDTYLTLTQSTLFINLTTTTNGSTLSTTKTSSFSDDIYRYIAEIIIYKYVCMTIFVIGMIGNGLSVIVFSRKVLRRRSCAIYFLALAVTDLLNLSFSLIDTVLPSYNFSITAKSLVICKLNAFMVYFTSDYSNYLLAVASIDRAVSIQCPLKAKTFCRAKVAIYIIITLGMLLLLINIHLLIGFEIVHSPIGQSGCTATEGSFFGFSSSTLSLSEENEQITTNTDLISSSIETTMSMKKINGNITIITNKQSPPPLNYRRFYEIYDSLDILRAVVIPFLIMVVCNILIIIRVLESRRSITTIITSTLNNKNKFRKRHEKDRQLTIMLLGSALAFLVLTLPTEINDTVRAFRSSTSSSILNQQKGIEPLITAIFITLGQLNHAIHFYIYTLTGSVFRDELLKLIKCVNCQLFGCECGGENQQHHSLLKLATNNKRSSLITTVNNNIYVNDKMTQIGLLTEIASPNENEF